MPEQVNISLGGIPFSLDADRKPGRYDQVRRAIDFYHSEPPEITLKVHCGWFPHFYETRLLFDSSQSWQLLQSEEKKIILTRSRKQDPYQVGVFSPDFRSGDIYVPASTEMEDGYIFPFSYPMGDLYMMNLLGTGVGMLFHATGVIYQGQGYLFTGNGGAGKTTTARLWQNLPGARVVNDDKVIVTLRDGKLTLYGTPWHGDGGMALPDSAPLKRVFILEQTPGNHIRDISPAKAAAHLLARTFVPLWDEEKIEYSLGFLDRLSQNTPCAVLGFLPEQSAVDYVLRNS